MTIKQKKAIEYVVESGGKKPIGQAMIEAGYDPTTAKNPSKLTESEAWKELMKTYLPDDKLLKKHDEALEATKWNDFTGEREEDHTTRLKAVELGYKLKKRLGPEILQQFNSEKMEIEFINKEDASNTT